MTTPIHTVQRNVAGRTLTIETGKLAGQANGAVTIRYGDTMLLATACASKKPREGIDFFPLTVEFEQRLYAAGKIPGSFFRREGRPPEEAILAARLADRPIRPLFPKGFRNETQIILTVLSADQENHPDILGIIGASAALSISDIPFEGPVAATRVAYIDGDLVVNPTYAELDRAALDLVVAGTREAAVMVEAGAKEVPEAVVLEAIERGQEVNQQIIEIQDELVALAGKPKMTYEPGPLSTPEVEAAVAEVVGDRMGPAIFTNQEKAARTEALSALRDEVMERLSEQHSPQVLEAAFDSLVKQTMTRRILDEDVRPDGRTSTQFRPITCEVGLLPRVHGSAMFQRGQTQILTSATLGSLSMRQKLDTISPEEQKRYLHHYYFPPYSTGEVKRIFVSRREVGHGALAERALEPVIPSEEEFPYTIRVVSEAVSSNGSTSMASACGSTLALMDAGVPIKAPVAGIAMGLVTDGNGRYRILTDIQGLEDHLGEMDFKVAGTGRGITALQMDIKLKGVTSQIIEEALQQAHDARMEILGKMMETLPQPRADLSQYAPRIYRIQIPVEKIGALIGPGGRTIRGISEQTKTVIDVENDGTVTIGAPDELTAQKAMDAVRGLTREVEVGQVYTGKIQRIMPFGAFVEILPGKDGLLRIGEIANIRIPQMEDVAQVGDEVVVMVSEIDSMGRVNLSRKAVLNSARGVVQDDLTERIKALAERPPQPEGSEGEQPMGQGYRRGGERGGYRGPPPRRGPGGPPPRGRPERRY